MPEETEEQEFKAAHRVDPSKLAASIPAKLAEMAIPIGAAGIAIGLICLMKSNNNGLVTAGAILCGSGIIADAIRRN